MKKEGGVVRIEGGVVKNCKTVVKTLKTVVKNNLTAVNWMRYKIWFISKWEKLWTLDLTITRTICILVFHYILDALDIF